MSSEKYMELLSREYPTKQHLCLEIINLNAILNLPKGTEHFMSDIHGEYEAFYHIINNCSGVIKEKIDRIFDGKLSAHEKKELCTLIYYPKEKLNIYKQKHTLTEDWYKLNLQYLITIAKDVSSKYTRSKVRKAMPEEFAYIIDELLHMQVDEDDNQIEYHNKIIETIICIEAADEFIIGLAQLIKRMSVDHLHIVGDICAYCQFCAHQAVAVERKIKRAEFSRGFFHCIVAFAPVVNFQMISAILHNYMVTVWCKGYFRTAHNAKIKAVENFHCRKIQYFYASVGAVHVDNACIRHNPAILPVIG